MLVYGKPDRIDQVKVLLRSHAMFDPQLCTFKDIGLQVPPGIYLYDPGGSMHFKNDRFDFVFSRWAIHHCLRSVMHLPRKTMGRDRGSIVPSEVIESA